MNIIQFRNKCDEIIYFYDRGARRDDMAEWSNARDQKSRPLGGPGSNPGVIASSFWRFFSLKASIFSGPIIALITHDFATIYSTSNNKTQFNIDLT